ncbi:hypothetical protein ACFSGX_11320 [Sphingomonas arantia]|uniref:HTH cro/C1-type domain-containing protein n=1 Tax=Sphingomonas arantia TaxID=1460676 RepID=A0ABW4U1H5_9SPHN
MSIRPASMPSNSEWTARSGVNSSFFTNVKNGSEPSVGNLRAVLEAIDITLPEFLLHEARGRLMKVPSQEALARAIQDVLPGLPRRPEKRAAYLAEALISVLALPASLEAIPDTERSDAPVENEEASLVRSSTK